MQKIIRISCLLLLGLLTLSACDKKKTNKSNPARDARLNGGMQPYNTTPNGITNPNSTTPYPNQQGGTNNQIYNNIGSQWVFLQTTDYNSFIQSIKGLVSASMDPNGLGNLSNYGDVALIGYIDMNQQYSINTANSRFRLEIWDDYARSGSASEIALSFNSLANYQVNGSQITLYFQDSYGQVIISGQIYGSDFYGTVSFRNSQSFDGSANYASGTLGSFQVPYCGFFRCQ